MGEARFSETRESAPEKRQQEQEQGREREETTDDDSAQRAPQEQASQPSEYIWAPDSPPDFSTSLSSAPDAPAGIPRRRSYTRTRDGVEVQGEVVVVEAWRRHTRVYGGGVCLACAESEERRLAMGLGVGP